LSGLAFDFLLEKPLLCVKMARVVRDFWLQRPDLWIAIGIKQASADKVIYDTFYGYDYVDEDVLGQVIYLDQFVRHFSRVVMIDESVVKIGRVSAASMVDSVDLLLANEAELVWYLMPWKHLEMWSKLFVAIDKWLDGRPLVDFPTLNRFFMDTYVKAYTVGAVAEGLTLEDDMASEGYDKSICEVVPKLYLDSDQWPKAVMPQTGATLVNEFAAIGESSVAVSLSGGVDSMLMAALLVRSGYKVTAIHIVYGNRAESAEERKFISTYCRRLGLRLYVYKVEWLRRSSVERAFYESVTRDLRFAAYKAVGLPVFMGHIQEDVIENIWTNLAHGTHLDDLAKFAVVGFESGVKICRPWLKVRKALIYGVASELGIPYLKNTTPTWSNRGKFRTAFYEATHAQYGAGVDNVMLDVADRIKKQAQMLDKVLYEPIIRSWSHHTKMLNIVLAVDAGLDADGWLRIFTDLAHNKLGCRKPSYVSCQEFARRVAKGLKNGDKICLKKGFVIQVVLDGGVWLKVL
jgi:tRNA(Ile)-lysidine synthetase-like protein